MDFTLTDHQKELKRAARDFSKKEITPVAQQFDQIVDPAECFPWDIVKKAVKLGYSNILIPEEYGGPGGNEMDLAVVTEQLAWGDSGVASTIAACGLVQRSLLDMGSQRLKDKWLNFFTSDDTGTALGGFAATEPGSGSDFASPNPKAGIKTTAVKDGDDFIINGTKCFITNGGVSKVYVVFARTDPAKGAFDGLSCFVVPHDAKGLSVGKVENKMGQRLSQQSELIFEDVRVHKDDMIGREGMGAMVAVQAIGTSCPQVGALSVGIAEAAFDVAKDYSRKRVQGGSPIIMHQSVGHMLADMRMKIDAARMMVYRACWANDTSGRNSHYASMAKAYASDVAMEVTTNAVQILGGYGYMKDYPLEKYMRDAKLTQIYDGTNQMHRNAILMFI